MTSREVKEKLLGKKPNAMDLREPPEIDTLLYHLSTGLAILEGLNGFLRKANMDELLSGPEKVEVLIGLLQELAKALKTVPTHMQEATTMLQAYAKELPARVAKKGGTL